MSCHPSHLAALQLAPLQQHPAFGAALTHLGRPPLRLSSPGTGREFQLMRRRFGPVEVGLISRADVTRRDLAHIREKSGCRLFLVNAETAAKGRADARSRGHPGVMLRHPAFIAELALGTSAAEMKGQMAQKWRNRLNRATASGIEIRHSAMSTDPDHWLLRADAAQQVKHRYRGYPAAFSTAFARANGGSARLFEAHLGGETLAAMLFFIHGQVATYHIGWNGKSGRQLSAHHLVMWRAMIALARLGVTRLDLGAVDTETAPGLARFKLGSGARCRSLGGTWAVRV